LSNKNPPEREATTNFFVADAKKFMERGGNLILVRCPSSGWIKGGENKFLSREEFWEPLVKSSKANAYHFEDFDQFKNLECPEWSHLSAPDARFFTTEIVKIMIADGVLTNSKTN
jgi:hypothetical protein